MKEAFQRRASINGGGGPMSDQDLPKPDYTQNMRLVGYCDQGGRADGVQIMVQRG
jgi:hypothetical protein